MKKLSDLKVGDPVWSLTQGEGILKNIDQSTDYLFECNFFNGHNTFDKNGYRYKSDIAPDLYTYPVKVVPVEYCYKVVWVNEQDNLCLSSAKYKTVDDFMKATCRENNQAQLIDFTKEEV